MAQQIFKQPRRQKSGFPNEDEPPLPGEEVGPQYDPTERLRQIREIAARAGDTSNIDQALADADNQNSFYNPSGNGVSNASAREAKNRRVRQAEMEAARRDPSTRTRRDVGAQETGVKMPDASSFYRKSAENRKKGGKKGLFVGLGAGGGLISVVAGFAFLLPFKLPAIMDNIVNDAGKRVERVVEKRAERILLNYILKGSSASCTLKNCIATGNPIGDLFANIRTSKFEANLLEQTGLKFEPGPNKTVKLVSNGADLGDVRNVDDILKILDKGANGGSLSVRDIRKIVKTQIPIWRFFKRAKFVNWLRLKYNIPRFGTRKQDPNESDSKYEEVVRDAESTAIENADIENLGDLVNCMDGDAANCKGADSGDAQKLGNEGLNKSGGATDLERAASEAMTEVSAETATEDATKVVSKTILQRVVEKITTKVFGTTTGKVASAMIPFVGEIDMAARIDHFIAGALEDNTLQKMHAAYMKRLYIVMFSTWAGFSDQNKAGDLGTAAVGMLSDQFNGEEQAQSYNLIASGKPVGQGLTNMQKINEDPQFSEWAKLPGLLYGTTGVVARAPLIAWYYTVSKVFDFLGKYVGDAVSWIVNNTPAKSLLNLFVNIITDLLTGLLSLIGMDVDPFDQGAKLHLDVHAGATAAFNDNCKDMGCRKITHDEAVKEDQAYNQERNQDLAGESFADRVLNLNNSESLAATVLTGMPSPSSTDPLGALALTDSSLLAKVPTSVANLVTPGAYADNVTTSEDLYGLDAYSGTDADLDQDTAPEVYDAAAKCPDLDKSGNSFNRCMIDRQTVDSMNCSFVKCGDLYGADDSTMLDTFADTAGSTPPSVAPAVASPVSHLATASTAGETGTLAAFLPLAALELSRRKQ